jgi:ribosomal protein S18 acetylase RimI-like enzyme
VADDVQIQLGDAALARPLVDRICQLYDAVFSQPPFYWRPDEPELHRERLVSLLEDPTYGVAQAVADDELVGFGYGFTLPPDTARWSRLKEPLPPEVTREWPGRTFVLFDYAVAPDYRGQGIGKALHDQLLGGRTEERATLTVQPTAVDTKRMYEKWGWRMVGQMVGGPKAAAPLFDAYLRDSLDDLRAAQRTP